MLVLVRLVGVMIRDSSSLVMAYCAQGIDLYYSPSIAKTLAIQRGLRLAIESNYSHVCIEYDAVVVVNLLINCSQPLYEIGIIIADILHLLNSLEVVSISYVDRDANKVAHELGKSGLSFVDDFIWLKDYSLSMKNLILDDCSG
ncbi:hypothetical protein ACOSP7_032869 [Xanthoceras sorbifolium]